MPASKVISAHLLPEISFTASRSGGPGGQHVNKVSTKVTLKFDVNGSGILTQEQKEVISKKLASKISNEGILTLSASNKRSQLMNKQAVLKKMDALLQKAFEVRKRRKVTKPGKAAVEKRLKSKKMHSEKKKVRQEKF